MSVHIKGHPIHTMLVGFPIALYAFSVVFDVIYAATGTASWYSAAYYNLLFGFIMTVPAAIFGVFDFTLIRDPDAKSVAARHMAVNLVATLLFGVSLLIRSTLAPGFARPVTGLAWIGALALSIAAMGVLSVGGWLGGTLVYRHRVGVGIEPADRIVPKPRRDEAGNVASDFPDYPATEPA